MQKGEQQRAHLIDVARDLFAAKGYEGTTTRALNKAAGTSDGLLYYYFPHGKQDILDTIVRDGLTQRLNELDVDFSQVTTREELAARLPALVTDIWQLFAREDNYQSFLITVRSRMLLSAEGASWVDQYTSAMQERILHELQAVGPLLDYTPTQLTVLASVITALVIAPLFVDLLLRNQRQLDEAKLAMLKQQVRLVLCCE